MKGKQNPQPKAIKQGDLEMLEWAAAAGDICLKYLDESGFSLWAEVLYSWSKKGQQNRDEQVQILDELDAHIKAHGGMEGFPNYSKSFPQSFSQGNGKEPSLNGHSELVL